MSSRCNSCGAVGVTSVVARRRVPEPPLEVIGHTVVFLMNLFTALWSDNLVDVGKEEIPKKQPCYTRDMKKELYGYYFGFDSSSPVDPEREHAWWTNVCLDPYGFMNKSIAHVWSPQLLDLQKKIVSEIHSKKVFFGRAFEKLGSLCKLTVVSENTFKITHNSSDDDLCCWFHPETTIKKKDSLGSSGTQTIDFEYVPHPSSFGPSEFDLLVAEFAARYYIELMVLKRKQKSGLPQADPLPTQMALLQEPEASTISTPSVSASPATGPVPIVGGGSAGSC